MPSRPPAPWWRGCIARLERDPRVRSPRAVCGAAWWKLPPSRRAAIVLELETAKDARARGAGLALAKAERDHAKGSRADVARLANPRELVSLVYAERKPGDHEVYEYEHDFEGQRPRLEMRGGALQIRGGTYTTRRGWIEG